MSSNFELEVNYSGVGELLRGPEVQELVKSIASDIATRAGNGYESDLYNAGDRYIASAFTATEEAMQDNLDNNTLLEAL